MQNLDDGERLECWDENDLMPNAAAIIFESTKFVSSTFFLNLGKCLSSKEKLSKLDPPMKILLQKDFEIRN